MIDHKQLLPSAFKYSVPVLLGYITLGAALGLFAVERGYPWYLSPIMGLIMYAGAGQFIAVGMFAAGATLAEMVLIQFVVNARHLAYGLSMYRRYRSTGSFRLYLIFSLTDETFALLSSSKEDFVTDLGERGRFMFLVSLFNQCYWVLGLLLGSLIGSIIPWDFYGVSFALNALFIVLMIEQILRIKRPAPFIISALTAIIAVFILPGVTSARLSLLSAMIISLGIIQLFETRHKVKEAAP